MGQGQGRRAGAPHRQGRVGARRRGPARPRRRPARQPARRSRPGRLDRDAPRRVEGAGRDRAPAGEGAAPDRDQGDRLDDQRRPRPARADHRRPLDRQDGDRDRHDPEPARPEREVLLRRDRPEGVDRRAGRRAAARGGRDGVHDRRRRRRRGGRADQVDGAVRRLRDGRVLPLQGRARARHLRRPDEAGRRLPAALAAAAPPAGPRGLPGRRLLPALAAARARVQAERRGGRRLADRAADHRDAGRRHLGLHPDQRDLDHRRPDLPPGRPLLLGRAPGGQRRHERLARRLVGADEGDEEGRRPSPPRPRAVPRAGGVRPVRLRARPGDAERTQPRREDGRDAQPAAVPAVADGGAGGRALRRRQRPPRRHPDRGRLALPGRAARAPAGGRLDLRVDPRLGRPVGRDDRAAERRAREGQEPLPDEHRRKRPRSWPRPRT